MKMSRNINKCILVGKIKCTFIVLEHLRYAQVDNIYLKLYLNRVGCFMQLNMLLGIELRITPFSKNSEIHI